MNYLLDTNVLVYALDPRDPRKRQRARWLLDRLIELGSGAIPAQALAELANVTLRKLGLPAADAYRQVERLETIFPVYPLTPAIVLEALRGVRDHQLSYFDAQVWAAAKLHQASIVLSEDFASGSTVEGVRFVDPFGPEFEVTTLK